jgi:RimJ/RimL family protein N-acetyltransferase
VTKDIVKRLARAVFGDYSIYVIYAWSPAINSPSSKIPLHLRIAVMDGAQIERLAVEILREQAGYAGDGAIAYGCLEADRVAGLCFYWYGKRYQTRNFLPLAGHEAKLVQIITDPAMRGRGVAQALITASSVDMAIRGFQRLLARVWHSNTPSRKAFERAGWLRDGWVVEINPFRRSIPWRFRFAAARQRTGLR